MWYQLQIENCPPTEVEALSLLLEERGALSISLSDRNDDPILEPELGTMPLWPEVIVQALFDSEDEASTHLVELKNSFPTYQYSIHMIPDQDWERAWMDSFKPQKFGKRLWICPSWHKPPEPEAINLLLDPGLAFGTGGHPTTGLCLEWLSDSDLTNKSLIDYGCGSGILALAAIKLGANHVYAIDIDPQALIAVGDNAVVNNIDHSQLTIGQPNLAMPACDILLANILLTPLLALEEQFFHLVNQGGELIVSGILSEQVEQLKSHYQKSKRWELQEIKLLDDWALVHFKRQ